VRAGTAGWSLSEEDLINCRAEGIVAIGVIVRETRDKYLVARFSQSQGYPGNFRFRGHLAHGVACCRLDPVANDPLETWI